MGEEAEEEPERGKNGEEKAEWQWGRRIYRGHPLCSTRGFLTLSLYVSYFNKPVLVMLNLPEYPMSYSNRQEIRFFTPFRIAVLLFLTPVE